MKNNIFFLLLILGIVSCDPQDDRMMFFNNSSDTVFVKMYFEAENNHIKETWVGLRKIEGNSKKRIGIMGNWNSEFNRSKDSVLNVAVFIQLESSMDILESDNINKIDSLLNIGAYKVHKYSFKDLEKNNWKINYPKDGFKKGKPLLINNKDKSKPKPNPKILKEKGIKDRWNKNDSL